jgi:acyl-coenzyme A synthetase/AMP-(fatty) acid ligase/acyl carrier protein
MNSHRAICNRLIWMQHAYRLLPSDRVLQKTPFSFDVSVWEFFWPLLNGASIVMARAGGHQDSAYLADTIRTEGITVLHFVPSMLRAFLDEPGLQACGSIRQIFCSGEVLPVELQNRCHASLAAELHNLYGPTEAAVDVTAWRCERDSARATVPIGRPISNTQIFILDRHLQPVPVGVSGELYIGGVNLGRGYLNRPDLTADRFIPNPFSDEPGARLYWTGDLARFLADGTIEYVGRIDHQVKVRGVRIELPEIESAMLKHPNVHAAAAIVWTQPADQSRLVGYFVAKASPAPSTTELRQFLSAELPQNMIPELFEELDALPLTTSGKSDRQRLPRPRSVRPNLESSFERPRSDTETIIADIWQRVLRIERVGVHDNFFDLGGYSLRMTETIGLLEERIGRRLSMVEAFQYPTIQSLAKHLSGSAHPEEEPAGDRVPDRSRQRLRAEQLRAARQQHRATDL